MVRASLIAAAALAALGFGPARGEAAPNARTVELVVPRAAAPNEMVDLEVQAGALARGAQIEVTTASGELIGTVSPFAIRGQGPAGTYTFPLPPGDIRDGRVTVCLSVKSAGTAPRAPSADEVGKIGIGFTRIAP